MTTQTNNKTSRRRTALLMALYTFLLALGAALPLAASYSEGIKGQSVESHIRGGAYQRRVEAAATPAADDEAERPLERVQHIGALESAPVAPTVDTDIESANDSFIDSRGS